MRRPRLLLDLLPYHPEDGGFTTAAHDLLKATAAFEDIDVIGVAARRHAADLEQFGTRIVRVRVPERARLYAGLAAFPWFARRLRADALHAEIGPLPWGVGIPTSITAHDLHFMTADARPPRGLAGLQYRLYWKQLYFRSLNRASMVKAISEATASEVRTTTSRNDRIRVVRPRVSPPPTRTSSRRRAEDGGELRLVFLGSVVPRRNLPFLLEALARVQRPWRLEVLGQVWWGRDEITSVDPRVTFRGFVSEETRDEVLANADVLVCPSLQEGFGYPVAEAMARGVYVLTSDIPVFAEYVPEECRFPLDSPSELARRIELLTLAEMARLRPTLLDSIARYSPAAHEAAHRDFFRELLGMD